MAYLLGGFAAVMADPILIIASVLLIFFAKNKNYFFISYIVLAPTFFLLKFFATGEFNFDITFILDLIALAVPLAIGTFVGIKIRNRRRSEAATSPENNNENTIITSSPENLNEDNEIPSQNLSDVDFYAIPYQEIQDGNTITSVWAKAFSEFPENNNKASARYIEYRVSQLKQQKELEDKKIIEEKNKTLREEEAKRLKEEEDKRIKEEEENRIREEENSKARTFSIFFFGGLIILFAAYFFISNP
tara:strand:- start:459 stop:1199 length:741 start_codon:yes stop_codon:yes gene_type:complete